MPNIELHGYGVESETMRRRVVDVLNGNVDPDETVTTVYPSVVTNLNGEPSPFLRIIASPRSIGRLVDILERLGQDIEVMPLGQWIPKKTEKSEED